MSVGSWGFNAPLVAGTVERGNAIFVWRPESGLVEQERSIRYDDDEHHEPRGQR